MLREAAGRYVALDGRFGSGPSKVRPEGVRQERAAGIEEAGADVQVEHVTLIVECWIALVNLFCAKVPIFACIMSSTDGSRLRLAPRRRRRKGEPRERRRLRRPLGDGLDDRFDIEAGAAVDDELGRAARELAVANGLAETDRGDRFPHRPLKRRAFGLVLTGSDECHRHAFVFEGLLQHKAQRFFVFRNQDFSLFH